jgi:hypothetical protein
MSPRYLTLASLVTLAISVATIIALFTAPLPPSPEFRPMPSELPIEQHVARARAYAEAGCSSSWTALLDPRGAARCKDSVSELERREQAWKAGGSPKTGYKDPLFELKQAADQFTTRADDHVRSAHNGRALLIGVWMVGLVAAVMGFVRSRLAAPSQGARMLIPIAVGLITMALLPAVGLVFMTGPLWSLGTLVVLTITAFGLAIGANLMPGAPHPLVREYERKVNALPKSERAGWLRKRILLGAALCLLGIGLTAATVFSGLPVGVAFTGLIVVGFFTGGVALVVAVRRTVER